MPGVGRLEDEEGAVVGVVRADLEPILDCILAHNTSGHFAVGREWRDAVVSGDGVVLHHDLRLLSASLREDDVVGVLEVEGAELCDIGVDERVDEINGEEDLLTAVGKVFVDKLVAGAIPRIVWVYASVSALID